MKIIYDIELAGFRICLRQYGKDRFSVQYGLQDNMSLTYAEAEKELGRCIMHACSCEGRLTNS